MATNSWIRQIRHTDSKNHFCPYIAQQIGAKSALWKPSKQRFLGSLINVLVLLTWQCTCVVVGSMNIARLWTERKLTFFLLASIWNAVEWRMKLFRMASTNAHRLQKLWWKTQEHSSIKEPKKSKIYFTLIYWNHHSIPMEFLDYITWIWQCNKNFNCYTGAELGLFTKNAGTLANWMEKSNISNFT